MTKKRLQNLRRKRFSLQQLAVRVISNQLTFYRKHHDELEKLKSLPGVLRDKILQALMKKRCMDNHQERKTEFENLKKVFPLLLSRRTRHIELNGILSFCPDRFKDGKIEKVTECDRYQDLNFPGTSNLRQIFLDVISENSNVVEAMPTLFPKVTCLMIKNTGSLEDYVMPKFNNLRKLHLSNPHCSGVFEKYLETYGRKLQSLYLGNDCINSTIDLESVFKYCPKLEKLSLLNVCLNTAPSSKMECFAELKELEWVFHFHNSSSFGLSERRHQEIMVLSNILSAPKLEKVNLEVKFLNENDLFILNSLIQEKRILKNLHTLYVYYPFPIDEALANFLKNACAFLPKLTDFKFGGRYYFKDPLLTNQSTVLSEIDASVCIPPFVKGFGHSSSLLTFPFPSSLPEHGGEEEDKVISDATGEEQRRLCLSRSFQRQVLLFELFLHNLAGTKNQSEKTMEYLRRLLNYGNHRHSQREEPEGSDERMDNLLKKLTTVHGHSLNKVWLDLVEELKAPNRYSTEQKLYAVAKMILKRKTKIFHFFPIAEIFEGNSKSMVKILKKISGKMVITEFRFLKEDSLKEKEERLELDEWNNNSLPENFKSDLEEIRVELNNMNHLHTIKIDVFPFTLKKLMDLCKSLRSLTTLEVVLDHNGGYNNNQSKKVRKRMKGLEIFKYNASAKNNLYDSFYEKTLDEFFIPLLPRAKILGKPGRFVDITRVILDMDKSKKSLLKHIAHKMMEAHVTDTLSTYFPYVNHLQVDWSHTIGHSSFYDGFLKFPELTHLTLTNVPGVEKLQRFMDAYEDKRVSDVTVNFSTNTELSMEYFQGLCMTLRKLVVRVIEPYVGEGSVWSLKYFECLTELEIEFAVNWNSESEICVVPIFYLFLAPKLEKVKLLGKLAVDAGHLGEVYNLIKAGKILQNVNHFEMQLLMDGSNSGHGGEEERKVISDATGEEQRRVRVPLPIVPAPKLNSARADIRPVPICDLFLAPNLEKVKLLEQNSRSMLNICSKDRQQTTPPTKKKWLKKRSLFLQQHHRVLQIKRIFQFKYKLKGKIMASINENAESQLSEHANAFFADHVKKVFENNKLRFQYSWKKTVLEEAISSLLTEIDFALVLSLFPPNSRNIVRILETINSKALRMCVFQIMAERNGIYASMPENLVSEVVKMANLRTLKVRQFSISFSTLVELCGELPRLKNLYFKIETDSDAKIPNQAAFVRVFGGLEVFQFSLTSNDIEFRKILTLQCVRCLPNLRLLGDPKEFVDMLPTLLDYEASPESGLSKLTHLTINLDRDVLTLSKFRDVTQLHIKRSGDPRAHQYEKTGLTDFQNLKNLILTDFNRDDMGIFLFFYGERLTHLTLDFKSTVILNLQSFFEYLFMRCETLEQLSLRNLDVEMPMAEKNWSFSSNYSLKELELEFSNESNRDAYIPLSDILSAPNLERVRMIRIPATLEELGSTMILVKEQKILKKVDRFELELLKVIFIHAS
ncbi:Hypothetical predicted protein [Cloeon dipterum]|uniref:Uncharacterized protein n=1 Tax=Cloeon dipterum TaxID=197152 RepID=A0A8S1E580_9INSE|nr:Hypothetical predicted protein [Cloeon dipterum]